VRLIKIALGITNPTVGAVHSNVDALVGAARAMAADSATIGCFPEQAVGGYPAEDLVQWHAFIAKQRSELERFAAETADCATVFVVGLVVGVGGQLFNVAAVVHRGGVLGLVPKEKLPTYGIFYERRTLARGVAGLRADADGLALGDYIFRFDAFTLAVEVCEDVWSPEGPMRRRCYSGADLVVNISSSPYRVGVQDTRREMLATRSADNQATLVYANRVGAQDGLIFDGGGFVFQNGRAVLEGPRFREGLETCVVDLDRTLRLRQENTTWRADCEAFQRAEREVPSVRAAAATADRSALRYPAPPGGSFFLPNDFRATESPRAVVLDELFEALAFGVKDYVAKTNAFRNIGVALSGGRDSLLSLLIAWRAVQLLHPQATDEALRGQVGRMLSAFHLPTRFSATATRAAAERICDELGVTLRVVSIDAAFEREVEATRCMLGDEEPTPVTRQNIQARLRGERMWNWANSADALFLQTSDMSEKAIGYVTVGGDLEGGLSVIANVPKTVVVALLERLRTRYGFEGIAMSLATVPSPELAASQEAESELMPFPVLDACLHLYAAEKLSLDEMATVLPTLFPTVPAELLRQSAERFVRQFTRSIYKWVQAPLTLHVGALDLERERALQLPVVERDEWSSERQGEHG
jgi:NAD+ synthase (glutamine-hydrolysing)